MLRERERGKIWHGGEDEKLITSSKRKSTSKRSEKKKMAKRESTKLAKCSCCGREKTNGREK